MIFIFRDSDDNDYQWPLHFYHPPHTIMLIDLKDLSTSCIIIKTLINSKVKENIIFFGQCIMMILLDQGLSLAWLKYSICKLVFRCGILKSTSIVIFSAEVNDLHFLCCLFCSVPGYIKSTLTFDEWGWPCMAMVTVRTCRETKEEGHWVITMSSNERASNCRNNLI